MRNIKVIEAPCDLGAGCRGASLGVDAFRFEAVKQDCKAYLSLPFERISATNQDLNQPDPSPNAHYIPGIVKFYKEIAATIRSSAENGEFPLIVAGDHSTAGASIAGIKAANPDKRLGVIWIDAHADIHSPYTTPSGNVHGMPLAAALHFDNKEEEINQLNAVEFEGWEALKKVGGDAPKILAEDIVYIGVRDTEEQEDAVLKRLKITNIKVREAQNMGMPAAAVKALGLLEACDIIYISFDVDSMDPSVSMGTGTPVPNGFTAKEVANLLSRLMDSPKISGLEIVEINPMLDHENKMAKASVGILKEVFNW